MILQPVDYIPEKPSTLNLKHNLYEMLEDFVTRGIKYAKVQYDDSEYVSRDYARTAIHTCIKKNGFPIRVCMRNGSLYLERVEV